MTASPISKTRFVLFKKENCGPCARLQKYLDHYLPEHPEYAEHLSVLQIENHTALREAYDLNLFPTLLIVDDEGKEQDRIVGGKWIHETIDTLFEMHYKK